MNTYDLIFIRLTINYTINIKFNIQHLTEISKTVTYFKFKSLHHQASQTTYNINIPAFFSFFWFDFLNLKTISRMMHQRFKLEYRETGH